MNSKMLNIENELKQMCVDVIGLLDDLKDQGTISEEEYVKHTTMKKDFIRRVNK